jgi:hypothetical protein
VAAELLYERDGYCRVQVPGDKPRTVLASRVKRERAVVGVDMASGPDHTVILPPSPRAFREAHPHLSDAALATSYAVATLRSVPKPPKPMRDTKYMAWVRDQHCCCVLGCGLAAKEAHHHGPRGMGQKTHDQLVLPMCARCHREFHDTGTVNGMTREDFDAFASRVQVGLMLDYYRDELGMFGTADLREVANALVEALRDER